MSESNDDTAPLREDDTVSGASSFSDLSRALLRRAQRGEISVWNRIHERYAKLLLLRARARLGERLSETSAADAEDVVQETLLAFFSKIDRYSLPRKGQGNGCIRGPLLLEMDRTIKNWSRKGGASGEAFHKKKAPLELDVPAADETPSVILSRREAFDRLSAGLASPRLSRLYRRVIVEVCLEERDPRELAEKEGIGYETFRKRLRRAKDVWGEISGIDADVELG